MSRQPTRDELDALKRLESDQTVLGFLEALLSEAKDKLAVTRDEAELRIIQGHAQAYTHLLRLIRSDPTHGKRR